MKYDISRAAFLGGGPGEPLLGNKPEGFVTHPQREAWKQIGAVKKRRQLFTAPFSVTLIWKETVVIFPASRNDSLFFPITTFRIAFLWKRFPLHISITPERGCGWGRG